MPAGSRVPQVRHPSRQVVPIRPLPLRPTPVGLRGHLRRGGAFSAPCPREPHEHELPGSPLSGFRSIEVAFRVRGDVVA